MSTITERAVNRPLSGTELAEIIRRDFEKLLDKDGMLRPHIGFGRVSYDIRLTLHLDNPAYPKHETGVRSALRSKQEIAAQTELSAVETDQPLKGPSPESIVSASQRTRKIDSPNEIRVGLGMPVAIDVRGQDGHIREEQVKYSPDIARSPDEKAVDLDLTDQTIAKWGLAANTPPYSLAEQQNVSQQENLNERDLADAGPEPLGPGLREVPSTRFTAKRRQ